ncbi:hypothetical protein KQX54_014942 [Cotesia glomerata]|uniref:HAT C-terminal dimerisation domain-containing protein n=1 Tax=Cotesia glomerata TaxID=32391 RepID=A0AAV7HK57_COTGL|nr:hypothetical protein KQX54_014942 [Cotesia glomerata]
MVATSQLKVIRDLTTLLGPFKESTEEISGEYYVTSSLAISVSNLLHPRPAQASPEASSSSIWCRHEKLITLSSNRAEIPSSGSIPNELKQYLDQPLIDRKSDPIEFWVNYRHVTPVLSEIALKYLICQASSVASGRLASAVNLAVPDNRSRLTGDHIKERVLLISIPDDYWFK